MIEFNTSVNVRGMDTTPILVLDAQIRKNANGNTLIVSLAACYASESSRQENPCNHIANDFPKSMSFDYDRTIDGTDILTVAHQKYHAWLTTTPVNPSLENPESVSGGGFPEQDVSIINL